MGFQAIRSFIYIAGNVIVASQNNTNEGTIYNQHNLSLDGTTGHKHTGAPYDGPKIDDSGLVNTYIKITNLANNVSNPTHDQDVVTRKYLTDNNQNNKANPSADQDFVTLKYLKDNNQNNKTDPIGLQDFVTKNYGDTTYAPIGGGPFIPIANNGNNVTDPALDGDVVTLNYLRDNNQNNKTDPLAAQDFATKNYADTTFAPIAGGNFVLRANNTNDVVDPAADGDVVTLNYLRDNNSNNKTDPVSAQDFATKNYVDTTESNLPVIKAQAFVNTAGGVGCTYHSQFNFAGNPVLTIDGAGSYYTLTFTAAAPTANYSVTATSDQTANGQTCMVSNRTVNGFRVRNWDIVAATGTQTDFSVIVAY